MSKLDWIAIGISVFVILVLAACFVDLWRMGYFDD